MGVCEGGGQKPELVLYLRCISDDSPLYLRRLSAVSPLYLRRFSAISPTILRCISAISPLYLRRFSAVSLIILRCISDDSPLYLRYITAVSPHLPVWAAIRRRAVCDVRHRAPLRRRVGVCEGEGRKAELVSYLLSVSMCDVRHVIDHLIHCRVIFHLVCSRIVIDCIAEKERQTRTNQIMIQID